jgi:tRNA modification GTPase
MGHAGVGVIRISGPDAVPIVAPLFVGRGAFSEFQTHTVHYGKLCSPHEGDVLDEALFLIMKAPRTYTGDDVVEIQAHGSPFVLQKIVALLIERGARLALPGEFTRRAFLAGRMDLAQAEAVMALIASQNDAHHQWALGQLKGALSEDIGCLRARLLTFLCEVEAEIDFPEEGIAFVAATERIAQVASVRDTVRQLLAGYESGRRIRDGWTVAIAGRPNVGKSSLFNRLLGDERAIVTPHPGTTRDLLREWIQIEHLSIQLVDMAGERDTRDPIESEGVRRGRAAVQEADLTLLILDASQPLQPEDIRLMSPSCPGRNKTIIILNKCDLPRHRDSTDLAARRPEDVVLPLSALTGAGIGELKGAIRDALGGTLEKEPPRVALLRHRNALSLAHDALERAVKVARESADAGGEFLAADLREALQSLGEITGETAPDEVLDQIFNQFCIGK